MMATKKMRVTTTMKGAKKMAETLTAPTTSATSAEELWNALYYWVRSVLPKKIKVEESHQDMPTPKGCFITISYAGNWHFAGTTASRMVVGRPDLPSPRLFTYRGSVELREVEGDGENLMKLVESLEAPDIQAIFEVAGISVLRTDGPTAMPALQQAQWRRESMLTLEMSWARAYEGSTLTIESVEISQVKTFGTIDDEENLVVDAQQNIVQSEELFNEFTVAT